MFLINESCFFEELVVYYNVLASLLARIVIDCINENFTVYVYIRQLNFFK